MDWKPRVANHPGILQGLSAARERVARICT